MPKRLTLNQTIAGQVTVCTFCDRPAWARYSEFNAVSSDGQVLICSNCIERLSVTMRLARLARSEWEGGLRESLQARMKRALAAERGPAGYMAAAVDIALMFAGRSHALLKARKNRTPLPQVKWILVRDADMGRFHALLERATEQAGIPVVGVTLSDYKHGRAEEKIYRLCRNDPLVAEHSVLLVRGIASKPYPPANFSCVFACEAREAISIASYIRGSL